MTKHTPGPWNTREDDRSVVTAPGLSYFAVVTAGNQTTREANARVIAEAPAMLTALKAAVEALEAMPPDYIAAPYTNSRLFAVRAAIAKAEGKS